MVFRRQQRRVVLAVAGVDSTLDQFDQVIRAPVRPKDGSADRRELARPQLEEVLDREDVCVSREHRAKNVLRRARPVDAGCGVGRLLDQNPANCLGRSVGQPRCVELGVCRRWQRVCGLCAREGATGRRDHVLASRIARIPLERFVEDGKGIFDEARVVLDSPSESRARSETLQPATF